MDDWLEEWFDELEEQWMVEEKKREAKANAIQRFLRLVDE